MPSSAQRDRHTRDLPGSLPDGTLDLIVFSEIGSYLEAIALAACKRLVAWTSPNQVLGGDQVHGDRRPIPGVRHFIETTCSDILSRFVEAMDHCR